MSQGLEGRVRAMLSSLEADPSLSSVLGSTADKVLDALLRRHRELVRKPQGPLRKLVATTVERILASRDAGGRGGGGGGGRRGGEEEEEEEEDGSAGSADSGSHVGSDVDVDLAAATVDAEGGLEDAPAPQAAASLNSSLYQHARPPLARGAEEAAAASVGAAAGAGAGSRKRRRKPGTAEIAAALRHIDAEAAAAAAGGAGGGQAQLQRRRVAPARAGHGLGGPPSAGGALAASATAGAAGGALPEGYTPFALPPYVRPTERYSSMGGLAAVRAAIRETVRGGGGAVGVDRGAAGGGGGRKHCLRRCARSVAALPARGGARAVWLRSLQPSLLPRPPPADRVPPEPP